MVHVGAGDRTLFGVAMLMSDKLRVLCFHPALAPYRLDFFNRLAELVDLEVVFHQENLQNQKFGQERLLSAAQFRYRFDTCGFNLRSRIFRWGAGRILREVKPDVVLSYEASPNVLELIFRRAFGKRWQLWTSMDDNADQIRTRTGLRKILRDFVLHHVDGVVTPSVAAGEAYREIVGKHLKIAVVPIVHDTQVMRKNADEVICQGRNWRAKTLPMKWRKVLLFVGRLAPVKNLEWLLVQMKDVDPTVGLALIGDGEEESKLRQLVTEYQLADRILFLGRKEGEDLYAIMSAADALVLCSHHETYGAVVAEALQWGTPCLVSACVGAKSLLLPGENGKVFSISDSEGFREALKRTVKLKRGTESLLPVDLKMSVECLTKMLSNAQ